MTINMSSDAAKKGRRRALRKKGSLIPATPPLLAEADGVFFLTLAKGDRTSVAYTINRLIDMLDAMDPDPDLEPSIGGFLMGGTAHDEREADYEGSGPDAAVTSDDEPSLGWCGHSRSQYGFREDVELDGADEEPSLASPERHPTPYGYRSDRTGDQSHWAEGGKDEREEENENGGDIQDEPHDHDDDREPILGWTEAASLTGALWQGCYGSSGDEEPSLGFVGHGTGWRPREGVEDMEQTTGSDDDREDDIAEHGIADADALHSEEYPFAEWPGDGSGHAIGRALLEKARRSPDGNIVREIALPTIRGVPQLRASDFDKLPWG